MDKSTFLNKVSIKRPQNFKIYDYDLLPPTFSFKELIPVVCKQHGIFHQTPTRHLWTHGCEACLKLILEQNLRSTCKDMFVRRSKALFGDRFTYERTEYLTKDDPLTITCKRHGDVSVIACSHLHMKSGCPTCQQENYLKGRLLKFMTGAKRHHGDMYDYSQTRFVNQITPIEIICKIHGSFMQTPENHCKGAGCQTCALEDQRLDTATFIERSRKVFGDTYDYSKVNYTTRISKVVITCRTHGDFLQRPGSHIAGCGCRKCFVDERRKGREKFIAEALKIHGVKYDYSRVQYKTINDKVEILCSIHGSFHLQPGSHLYGKQGCRGCKDSKGEVEVARVLDECEILYEREYKIHPQRFRYDFYIPEANICIEFHGNQHYRPVEFFGGEEGFRSTVFRDKMKESILRSLKIPLIILPYQFLSEGVVDRQLKLSLKKVYSVWLKVNGQLRCFKNVKSLRDSFGLLPTPCSIYETVKDLEDLGHRVQILLEDV